MMLEQEIKALLDKSQTLLGEEATLKVKVAMELAIGFHQGQIRKFDKSPYVIHCFQVARYCMEWGMVDTDAICAALLHDSVEDAPVWMKPEETIGLFDRHVLVMVQALSKIRNVQTGAGDMPATYRRILSAASKDLRILIIKMFDVMHNSETFHVHKPAKAKVKASLGLIYVGVARRLGMMALADALIEQILPYLMPVQTKKAQKALHEMHHHAIESMDRLRARLKTFTDSDLALQVVVEKRRLPDYFYLGDTPGTGRLMRIGWPAYRVRFVVRNSEDAWRVLGRAHHTFDPMPRHIRDYLNAPRINGFRALTTRILWEGYRLTLHVMREQDVDANRMGILAQWGQSGPDPKRYMRLLATLGDSDLRMSEVYSHVLPDLLDVYTPKGDRFTFPVKSVVLDFAYLVHSEVGDRCVGATVNGVHRGPDYQLADGDVVSIITAKDSQPMRAWLGVVKTARARTMIKQAIKRHTIPVSGVEYSQDGFFSLTSLRSPDMIWATCCLPLPNDTVVGRATSDGRWMVHRETCHHASGAQWKQGSWDIRSLPGRLDIVFTIDHKSGSLLVVLELLAEYGINGHSIQGRGRSESSSLIEMTIGGRDIETLGRFLRALKELPSVQKIQQYQWKGSQKKNKENR
ncbi:HD domain-containing protein [Magnetococcales bacterium HHB-1]